MPPTEVHLIGEHHYDFLTFSRYQKAFSTIQPDVISVEAENGFEAHATKSLKHLLEEAYGSTQEPLRKLHSLNFNALVAIHNLGGVYAARGYKEKQQKPVDIVFT